MTPARATAAIPPPPRPLPLRPRPATSSRKRPAIATIVSPNSTPMSRMLSRMSPFSTCENSCPITPCSSSRFEPRQRSARDDDHGIVDRVARRERIDRALFVHHEHARHRDAGRDRHFLDDVQQTSIEQVARRRIDGPCIDHLRDSGATGRQRTHLERGAAGDQADHDQRVGQEEAVRQRRRRPRPPGRHQGREVERGTDDIDRNDDAGDREHEQHDQSPARAARHLLVFEEVHRLRVSEGTVAHGARRRPPHRRQNCTFTGRRSSSLSVDSSSSAEANENALAMTFVGNCCEAVL